MNVEATQISAATTLSQATLDRILASIPLADFTEDFEFGREEKDVTVCEGIDLFYTVSAYLFRLEHGTYRTEWDTLKADVHVDDLMIYIDEEEVELDAAQRAAITEHIKQTIEY